MNVFGNFISAQLNNCSTQDIVYGNLYPCHNVQDHEKQHQRKPCYVCYDCYSQSMTKLSVQLVQVG